ncbi:MAG TPA: hypothetical protein VLE27_05385 [Thermoanaerobaculia bacterium]|nr:hypothetical protein [Thermoanaerobaculia bacterium]
MADFRNRYAELLGAIEEEKLSTWEHTWLVSTLNQYDKAREELLESLVGVTGSFDPKRPQEGSEWKDALGKGLSRVSEKLAAFQKPPREDISTYLRLQLLEFTSAEGGFFANLRKSEDLGVLIDRMLSIAHNLDEKRETLESVWEADLDDAGDFNEKAMDVADEIQEVIDEAIAFAAENNKTLQEKIALAIKTHESKLEGSPGVTDALAVLPTFKAAVDVIVQVTGKASEWWLDSAGKVESRKAELRKAFEGYSRLFIAFRETRADTEKFLREWNLEEAEKTYKQVHLRFDALIMSGNLTRGQKDDLGQLKKEVVDRIDDLLELVEDRFEDFVSEHQSKFFGPISASIQQMLTHEPEWESKIREFKSKKLYELLRQYQETAKIVLSVQGLDEAHRDYLKETLKDDFDKLMKAIAPIAEKSAKEDLEDAARSLVAGLKLYLR